MFFKNPFVKEGESSGVNTSTTRPRKPAFPGLLKDITIFEDSSKHLRRGISSSNFNQQDSETKSPTVRLKKVKKARSEMTTELFREATTEVTTEADIDVMIETITPPSQEDESTTKEGAGDEESTETSLFNFDTDYIDYITNDIEGSGGGVNEASGEDLETFDTFSDEFVLESKISELEEDLVVDTDSGRVYGTRQVTATGAGVREWHGVPYAEPPEGKRRFLPPLPPRPWGGVRRARTGGPRCWDSRAGSAWDADSSMSEDCLYLSVWSGEGGPGRAVLVWLTAGGEAAGAGGAELAVRGEVLVVRVESRRGALGFLATGDEVSGNAGLMDQVQALHWVRANIDRFGGDPGRVTIMGVGPGADLASLHLLSPLACPLFQAVILMSGATPPPLPSTQEASQQARALARLLGCPQDGPSLLSCLRAVDPQVLTNQEQVAAPGGFHPTVDGQFMVEQPGNLMEGNFFKKTPMLVGTNTAEGQEQLLQLVPDMDSREVLMLSASELDSALARVFPSHPDSIQSLVGIISCRNYLL